ncbi:MAG: DUF4296 domain-containing protein [Flavobacteriales bacterium]|nr:DUF4296 domain-containing protein [Crocinitomicaceae bacterium]NBX79650.1 DUF4296 domain-containing protein [Flavobacteriales bacterium]NCA22143.1 DUF4296 domain-containing protein [Crocinitomicaceae bacterium]
MDKFKKLATEKDCYSHYNMKSLIAFFGILIILLSCTNNGGAGSNDEILSEEQMVEVTQEVMLLENYYQTKYGSPNVYKKALDSSVNIVFKRFSVTKKQYENTFNYYAENPELYKELQMKIIESLNEKHL